MPKLHFVDKNFCGQVYELVVEKTTVGRGEHNTLVVAHDSVSANHCEILVYGTEVIVRDKESRNGTFLDGVRVNGQMPIHTGQTLRFGSVEARVEVEKGSSGDTGTDITAIFEYSKVMRERRRQLKHPVQPHSRVEPAVDAKHDEEQTVLIPNSARQKAPTEAPASPVPVPPTRNNNRMRLVVGLVIGALIVLLIWSLRR